MTYRRKDAVYKRAKATGYRARSAYKLAELDDRFRLLGPGRRVLDLGAWPGGWMQVALERVGSRGVVVGIDVATIDPLPAPNAHVLTGDVRDPGLLAVARDRLGAPADVVLSDLAPKLTGIKAADEARCEALAAAVMAALPGLLHPGGALLMKLFMGPAFEPTVKALRTAFEEVRTTRPASTREHSAELYVVARGFRPGPAGE